MKVKELIEKLQAFDGERDVVISILQTNAHPFPCYEKTDITEIVPCYGQSEITLLKLKPEDDITLWGFDKKSICICTKAALA